MKIKIEIVEHIASLSRIKLSEKEKEIYSQQLAKILEYVELLNKLNTNNIEPTYQITKVVDVMRKDEVKPFRKEKGLISAAPEKENSFVKVKAVFE
jgi:aspartyl-tRNA(Asn)/glutamyl-tRNA(Gln) amidotransferase subunit C